MKLPFGPGVWPAFWMLGGDYSTVSWPDCGEIDILENFGSECTMTPPQFMGPFMVRISRTRASERAYHLPNQETVHSDYHLFSIEWAQDSVQFFVDGTNYESLTPASLPSGGQWVFNQSFFMILNLAIGGPTTFLGTPLPDYAVSARPVDRLRSRLHRRNSAVHATEHFTERSS